MTLAVIVECPNANAVAAVAAINTVHPITTGTLISPPVAHLYPMSSYFRGFSVRGKP